MKNTILTIIALTLSGFLFAQHGLYESAEFKAACEKGSRARDGKPVNDYWQNHSDYKLKATFDPASRMLHGEGWINYQNNSPDTLRYLVVKLLPNIFKKGSAKDYPASEEGLNDGMVIDSISVNNMAVNKNNRREYFEHGTNLYLIFKPDERLNPGSSTEIYVKWNYEVVLHGIRNGAYTDSAFFIGYWYPQMAVYDDVYGWDRENYTGKQETYNDLGNYSVEIYLPEDYIVWATGDQTNEEETFSKNVLQRIEKSRTTQKTIHILTKESYSGDDILTGSGMRKWCFEASAVPDFAWACSNYYYWDATSVDPGESNSNVWVSAVYPPGTKGFDKVAKVAQESILYLSNEFPGISYPYNKHITFNGINYVGVEYPMMANNGDHAGEEMYTELTIHEIAHNYIPFYMLSNERKHAWIDEGWVKLIGEIHGESLGIKRENKTALNTFAVYARSAGKSTDLPLIVPSGFMTAQDNFYHSYAKATAANLFLLELISEKGIENPLKEFLLCWKHKHPTPYDFFYFMNDLCGEDLSWYWNPWYFNFSYPDQEIKKGNGENEVLVVNKGGIPLPVVLKIVYNSGEEEVIKKSIWNWSDGKQQLSVKLPAKDNIERIELGASYIPDTDKTNNVLSFDEKGAY